MSTTGPRAIAFSIHGPIERADLPGLCDRVCSLLSASGAEVAHCDVTGVEPDAVTVDALARLQLGARRHACRVVLRGASDELRELVAFMGLTDVLVAEPPAATRRSAAAGRTAGRPARCRGRT